MRKCEEFKLGHSKWTSRAGIGAVILMLIVYTVICYIIIDQNEDTVRNVEASAEKSNPSAITIGEEENQTYIPVPIAEYQVNWECGTYYSFITEAGMESYLNTLAKEGWKDADGEALSPQVREGTHSYKLIKGDTVLQMITFLPVDEISLNNSILLRVDRGGIDREILNSREAVAVGRIILPQIQDAVDQKVEENVIPSARQKVTALLEIYIPEAYERLSLQAFAAVSDQGFTGCFLVRKGVVSYVEGDLVNASIMDIDLDGSDELVDLYSTWEDGLFKNYLIAYEYQNPIYFSSLTEVPLKKYSNCFVPEGEYEKLSLIKRENEIRLIGELSDYGAITVKEKYLVLKDMEHFPYAEWAVSYDQRLLQEMDKKHPTNPPDINISIGGVGLDYVVQKTSWDGETSEFTKTEALDQILARKAFLPKVYLGSFGIMAIEKTVDIDFGDSIPDSIQVSDSILDENGKQKYGEKIIHKQTVKILDSSRVSFILKQHNSLYLSSNSEDYDRDWRRLFLITCRWGEKECVYALLINTGKNQQLTEVSDLNFLQCEGSYSSLSSSWGLGLSVKSDHLPKRYIIEWQVDGGKLRSWNATTKKPVGITGKYNGYPVTYSWDDNQGAVIWNPISFRDTADVTIRAFIYEDEKKKNPLAFDEIVLTKVKEIWQQKSDAT
jgi:hypothetical protein